MTATITSANLVPLPSDSKEYTLVSALLWSYGLPYDVLFFNADATFDTSVVIHTLIYNAHIQYNIVFDKDFEESRLNFILMYSRDNHRTFACNKTAVEMLSAAKLLDKQFWFRLGDIAFM